MLVINQKINLYFIKHLSWEIEKGLFSITAIVIDIYIIFLFL